jgi:hypothetical protein
MVRSKQARVRDAALAAALRRVRRVLRRAYTKKG